VFSEPCIGPLKGNKPCHGTFKETEKEVTNYCLRWKPFPCPPTEHSDKLTSSAWLYNTSAEVWGLPITAEKGTYDGGGYFMKLDVNSHVSKEIFIELIENEWFDAQTRAVILEFTVYNANANLFAYAVFVGEFPEVGGFIPYVKMHVFRLFLHAGPDGEFILILKFSFCLMALFATLKMVYEASGDTKAFFKCVWNYLDIAALLMSYITIGVYIYMLGVVQKTIDVFHKDKNAYVGFENIAFIEFLSNTTFSGLVFLLSIRVSRILGYSGKINEMAAVISNAAGDLLGFLVIFSFATFAYVLWGNMLFGKDVAKFRSLFTSFGTITESIIGKNQIAHMFLAKPFFAELYYFTFVWFVLLTLATMAAAILNFSITAVKEEQEKISPTNIVEVIWDRLASAVGKVYTSRNNQSKFYERY